jgi:hypothetical protein
MLLKSGLNCLKSLSQWLDLPTNTAKVGLSQFEKIIVCVRKRDAAGYKQTLPKIYGYPPIPFSRVTTFVCNS